MQEQISRLEQQIQQEYRKSTGGYVPPPETFHKAQRFSFITNNHFANFILMPLAGIFWTGGFIFSNQHKVSPFESNFTRYWCQIVSQIALMLWSKQSFHLKHQKQFKLLIIRAIISSLNGCVVALFQMYLPLPIYYTLAASTVVFTFVLNYLIYHTPLTSNQIKSIIVAILGIVLVINGRYIYALIDDSYAFQSGFEYSSTNLGTILFVSLCVVLWNIVWAYAIVITGRHHSSLNQMILINSIVGIFFFGCTQIFMPQQDLSGMNTLLTRKPDIIWKTILFTGVPLAFANYFFNWSLFLSSNTGVTTVISQVNILYVYIISTVRYHQEINLVCLLGAIMLVFSIYRVLILK